MSNSYSNMIYESMGIGIVVDNRRIITCSQWSSSDVWAEKYPVSWTTCNSRKMLPLGKISISQSISVVRLHGVWESSMNDVHLRTSGRGGGGHLLKSVRNESRLVFTMVSHGSRGTDDSSKQRRWHHLRASKHFAHVRPASNVPCHRKTVDFY